MRIHPENPDGSPDSGDPDDRAALTEIAARVAGEAAVLAMASRAEAIENVGTKSSETDVVTAADTAVERAVRARLAKLRPGEPVLGEEGGGRLAPAGLCWVVDPIDGTVNYLYGYPWFAVSLAVQRDGVSIAGAVVEPASGRVWTAARGQGAWLEGKPLSVSRCDRLDMAMLATGFGYQQARRARQAAMLAGIIGKVRDLRRSGSAALDLCAVAAGWVDGYVEHGLSRWDWAAGALVAAEAGAVVGLPGTEPDLGGEAILAATPGIAESLRAALVRAGSGQV